MQDVDGGLINSRKTIYRQIQSSCELKAFVSRGYSIKLEPWAELFWRKRELLNEQRESRCGNAM